MIILLTALHVFFMVQVGKICVSIIFGDRFLYANDLYVWSSREWHFLGEM